MYDGADSHGYRVKYPNEFPTFIVNSISLPWQQIKDTNNVSCLKYLLPQFLSDDRDNNFCWIL